MHDADADAEHREGDAHAEQQVLQAQRGNRGGFTQRDGKVADEEKQGTDHGNDEENCNLPLGTLFGPGILIGTARAVGR